MGSITIDISGSFGRVPRKTVSAISGGHANAITEAVQFLLEQMPAAIKNDHECHRDGMQPGEGFGGLGKLEPLTKA